MTRVGNSVDLNLLRFSLSSGDNVGTNSEGPNQAGKSVELIWFQTV